MFVDFLWESKMTEECNKLVPYESKETSINSINEELAQKRGWLQGLNYNINQSIGQLMYIHSQINWRNAEANRIEQEAINKSKQILEEAFKFRDENQKELEEQIKKINLLKDEIRDLENTKFKLTFEIEMLIKKKEGNN